MTDKELDELEARLLGKTKLGYDATWKVSPLHKKAADAIAELRKEKAELETLAGRAERWFTKLENHAKGVIQEGGPHAEHYYTPMIALLNDLRTALKGKGTE